MSIKAAAKEIWPLLKHGSFRVRIAVTLAIVGSYAVDYPVERVELLLTATRYHLGKLVDRLVGWCREDVEKVRQILQDQ